MKKLTIIFIFNSLLLITCGLTYDREYYEKVTGIVIPKSSDVLETFDNGEYYTITSFKMDIVELQVFLQANHFEGIEQTW